MSHPSRQSTRHLSLYAAATLLVFAAVAASGSTCQESSPEAVGLKTTVDYLTAPGGTDQQGDEQDSEPSLRQQFIDDLDAADQRIWAATAGDMLDQRLANALIAAHGDDVDVQLVADVDDRGQGEFARLQDAGIPITWGDGEITYLPGGGYLGQVMTRCVRHEASHQVRCSAAGNQDEASPCDDPSLSEGQGTMCRPGDFNRMSHRFFIIDERTVWNFAAGFGDSETPDLGWRAESEYLREDLAREFQQMFGGVFATELDSYSGPLKSSTDENVDYLSDNGRMQLRFNPQERLMKHVVDEAYRAKQSVQIVTRSLTNPFLLDALEYKDQNGFDVEIVVGADTQPEGQARDRLEALGALGHPAGESLPSVLVVDDQSGDNQRQWARSAVVLSHPFWHAAPFSVLPPENPDQQGASDRVRVYRSDHYVDGNLWRLREFATQPGELSQITRIGELVDTAVTRSSQL